jgi:hypothetical protein
MSHTKVAIPLKIKEEFAEYIKAYKHFEKCNPNHKLHRWLHENCFKDRSQLPVGVRLEIRMDFIYGYDPQCVESKINQYLDKSEEESQKAVNSIKLLVKNYKNYCDDINTVDDPKKDEEILNIVFEISETSNVEEALVKELEWLRSQIENYQITSPCEIP